MHNDMKNNIFHTALAAALILLAGCDKERIDFDPNNRTDEEVGYLVLAGMNVNVNTDSENISQESSSKRTAQTRAAAAPDDYIVSIANFTTQAVVLTETYGEICRRTEPIALAPGRYRVTAKSPNADSVAPAAFDTPAYSGGVTVTVVKNATQQVPTIVCKLANIKTSVYFSDLLKASFDLTDTDNPLQVTVALGDNVLTFPYDEERIGYFRPEAAENTLVATLSGSYNTAQADQAPVYKAVKQSVEIHNVSAGQWRQIRFAIQVSHEGNVTLSVQVNTWVDDEPIDVDVMSALYAFAEEIIPDDSAVSDPDSPVLTLDNDHDVEEPFIINGGIFDDEGTCTDRLRMIFRPKSGSTVERVVATVTSENERLMQALADAGFENGRIDITDVVTFEDAVYTTVERTATALRINATSVAMQALYQYAGEHTVRLAATDSENRTSYTNLTIIVRRSNETGPSIVWLKHDIDSRYVANELTGDDSVVIEISSQSGITDFLVDINGGNVLTDPDLVSLNLAPHMDLVTPATDQMDAMLNSLGFKTTDDVLGATKLTFNISEFMPMLVALGNAGPVDFKLTVTDAEGTVSKTIQLTVLQD